MTNTKSKATRLGFAKTLLSASIAVAISPTLVAQEQAGTTEADVKKFAVVGTRSAPRSIGDSAVPVDIISAEEFKSTGSTDITTMMQAAVPSFNVNGGFYYLKGVYTF